MTTISPGGLISTPRSAPTSPRHEARPERACRASQRRQVSSGADELTLNSASNLPSCLSTRAKSGRFRRQRRPDAARAEPGGRNGKSLVLALVVCLAALPATTQLLAGLAEARSIDDSAPPNGRIDIKPSSLADGQERAADGNRSTELPTNAPARATSSADTSSDSTERSATARAIIEPPLTLASENNANRRQEATSNEQAIPTTTQILSAATSAASPTTTTPASDEDEDDESPGAGPDDDDAENCQGLSSGPSAPGQGPSDNERLVNLQTCLQKKVKKQLTSSARSSMELFDKLSLSGACTASLLNLMSGLGELKGFAFKFLDASAKVPSGMMSGLLSDFGDFEQCLAIRSNPRVDPRYEADEGGYSGKYCLLNIRMRYRVRLGPNSTAPEGIYPDGVLWDELVRNYWTSNSTKGFQVGVCVPSKCDRDDLAQMLGLFAHSYHVFGELGACQDTNDLRRQQEPDLVQQVIIYAFLGVFALNLVGTYTERYSSARNPKASRGAIVRLLVCFSIRRNWLIFLRPRGGHSMGGPIDRLDGMSPTVPARNQRSIAQSSTSMSFSETETCSSAADAHIELPSRTSGSLLSSSLGCGARTAESRARLYQQLEFIDAPKPVFQPLTVKIQQAGERQTSSGGAATLDSPAADDSSSLAHLWGLKLLVIVWITVGHSFLYPSANNYQHYRSIINMNITRDSVWFATTNFILGIDMLLYMTGLMFVHKLAQMNSGAFRAKQRQAAQEAQSVGPKILRLIARKVLRFWPTYLSVIALAVIVPLVSNGPMWPEMVSRRLGETCRANWWANLLMVNNLLDSSRVCLPSSWFISVIMQCFLVGSGVVTLANRYSPRVAIAAASALICVSSSIAFWLAYANKLNAPAIRMDESFVMELDENIFKMYTSTISNVGPFLVGMLGGFVLLGGGRATKATSAREGERTVIERLSSLMFELNLAFAMALLALVVLSSVFFTSYTPLWSAVYWSGHRVGWALVTGYLIHQCATGKWRLLRDLLSLSTFIPLGRLIFIAYLVHPMFIHIHSGLVRDGLHVSLYNMMNIYITRLVLSFALALLLHLFVELPFCALEQSLIEICLERRKTQLCRQRHLERAGRKEESEIKEKIRSGDRAVTDEPLLAVVVPEMLAKPRKTQTEFERQENVETTIGGVD